MEAARSLYERLWAVFGYGPWRVADTSTGLPLWSNVKAYFPGIYGVLGANGELVALTNRKDVAELIAEIPTTVDPALAPATGDAPQPVTRPDLDRFADTVEGAIMRIADALDALESWEHRREARERQTAEIAERAPATAIERLKQASERLERLAEEIDNA